MPMRAVMFVYIIFLVMLVAIAVAFAQPMPTLPPVPTEGISPVLQWVLGLVSIIFTIFVPILSIWLKNYLDVQNVQSRSALINSAVVKAANLADLEMTDQKMVIGQVDIHSPIMRNAVLFVKASYPDAIAATPQADEMHLSASVLAELHRIGLAKAEKVAPSVVVSPVSLVR